VETGFKREVAIPPSTLRVRNARRRGEDVEPICLKYDGRATAGPGLLTDMCVCVLRKLSPSRVGSGSTLLGRESRRQVRSEAKVIRLLYVSKMQ